MIIVNLAKGKRNRCQPQKREKLVQGKPTERKMAKKENIGG